MIKAQTSDPRVSGAAVTAAELPCRRRHRKATRRRLGPGGARRLHGIGNRRATKDSETLRRRQNCHQSGGEILGRRTRKKKKQQRF